MVILVLWPQAKATHKDFYLRCTASIYAYEIVLQREITSFLSPFDAQYLSVA